MFEIRLDDDFITMGSELRDVLIETIDYIIGDDGFPTLKDTYEKYRDYDSEDLVEEIQDVTDEYLDIIVNLKPYVNVSFTQYIMED